MTRFVLKRFTWTAVAVAAVVIGAAATEPSAAELWRTIAGFAICVVLLAGFRVVTGLTGLVSLAHFGVVGVGAYAAAMVAITGGHFGPGAFVAGVLAGTIAGLTVSLVSLKLDDDYYALATVAAGEVFANVFRGAGSITGGPNGLSAIPPVQFQEFALDAPHRYALLCVAGGVLAFVALSRYELSTAGLAIRAAADEGGRVECLGVRPEYLRLLSFAFGGALAGLGGALVAATDRFVGPESFGIHQSITFLCFLVIGGGLIDRWGVLIAALFASFGLEALRALGEWQMIVVSAAALVLLLTRTSANRE